MTRLHACLGGCGTLVATVSGRCYDCRRQRQQTYDKTRPEHHAVYRTSAWRKLSAEVRAAESRCRWCLKPIPFGQRIADHIVPLAEAPERAYDRTNLATSCKACNVRRGRWAKVPDPESDDPRGTVIREAMSVGDRMAAILGGES